jgi:hypothetical protein
LRRKEEATSIGEELTVVVVTFHLAIYRRTITRH